MKRVVEAAVVRAMFPNDASRRAFLRAVGTSTAAAAIAAFFVLGVWACGRTGRDLGVPDHGAMNWDEVVAFLAVLLFAPAGGWWTLGAFAAFRFFDMAKPPPIRRVERALAGGLGVMADDAIAAFYTLLVLAVAQRLVA